MNQRNFRVIKKTVFLTILLLGVFSLVFLNGCKSGISPADTTAKNESQAPALPPILSDGTRTSYADIVERVTPAVVKVTVEQKAKPQAEQQTLPFGNDFFKNLPQSSQQQRPQIERALGSGVILSADGTILTNNHVVEGADKIKVEMIDKRTFEAKIVGSDPASDLAVLKIEAKDLPFLTLGDTDKVRVGDVVLAIGYPLGIGQTVTSGIISAKNRRTGLTENSYENFLQTDAPINRGNSGGALLNLNGELIGINSQILSPSGGSIGIGFAIPSNMVKPIVEQLLKDGKVHRGQIGVTIQNLTEEMAQSLELKDTKGVLVSGVKKDGPADKAGIKRGDVITAINGEKIEDSNTLRNKVAGMAPGTDIAVTILREGKEQQVTARLDEFSASSAKTDKPEENSAPGKSTENGKLGLDLQPVTPEITKQLGIPADTQGLIVTDVDPTGPAAEEGVQRGDVITEINRHPVTSFEDVQAALSKNGNKPALLLITRGGQTVYLTIEPKS